MKKFKELGYKDSAMNDKSKYKKISAHMMEKGSLGGASTKFENQKCSDNPFAFEQACDPELIFKEILKK